MQFAATGINIKEAVKRFIIELEARKDIPPKMLYSLFCVVAPWDQSVFSHTDCGADHHAPPGKEMHRAWML
jgi:hypothetical protein